MLLGLAFILVAALGVPILYEWARLDRLAEMAALFAGADVRSAPSTTPPTDFPASHLKRVAHLGGEIATLAAADGRLYVGRGNELVVLDARDPGRVRRLGGAVLHGRVRDIAVSGTIAHVADENGGLVLVDVSDAAAPRVIGGFGYLGAVKSLALAGHHAYLAAGFAGIQTIDVENPSTPRPTDLDEHRRHPSDASFSPRLVRAAGKLLYVADDEYRLRLLDLADPARPRPIAAIDDRALQLKSLLAVDGTRALMAGAGADGGPILIDASDAAHPVSRRLALPGPIDPFAAALRGGLAYLGSDEGLTILDLGEASRPVLRSFLPLGAVSTLALDGNRLWVGTRAGAVVAVDISDAARPRKLGRQEEPPYPLDVAVSGRYGYLVDYLGDLDVLDLADPTEPLVVSRLRLDPGQLRAVAVDGRYGCVLTYRALFALDLADPVKPRLGAARGIDGLLWNSRLFVVAGHVVTPLADGYAAYDPRADGTPRRVALPSAVAGRVVDMAVAGATAFIVTVTGTTPETTRYALTRLDVSELSRPRFVASLSLDAAHVSTMAVAGSTVVLGVHEKGPARETTPYGLRFFDASDPTAIKPLGFVETFDPAWLAVDGGTLYAVDIAGTIEAFGMTDPARPQRKGFYGDSKTKLTHIGRLTVANGVLLAMTGDRGLLVLRAD